MQVVAASGPIYYGRIKGATNGALVVVGWGGGTSFGANMRMQSHRSWYLGILQLVGLFLFFLTNKI